MTSTNSFATDADQDMLEQHGVGLEELNRQWSLLTHRPQRVALTRPCTVGDGIEQLPPSDHDALIKTHRESAAQGRWIKFVPASGAASRMFALRSDDDKRCFGESIGQFAFADEVRQQLANQGLQLSELLQSKRFDDLVDAVISPGGLGYGDLPKGLIKFHRCPDGSRTPFEEHLLESLACLSDRDGTVAAHFTVSPEHQQRFADRLKLFQATLASGQCRVSFSIQHPSTDTIAMDSGGGLLRDDDGNPVLRPGGHGALIENLDELEGHLIFVKNIDNVRHERMRGASEAWIEILGGYLVRLQNAVYQHMRSLQSGDARSVFAARDFVDLTFPGASWPEYDDPAFLREAVVARLNRPLRVCGMVKNEGEPGGGPYWVRHADSSISPQIVESAEVDADDAGQQTIFGQATHFNPVFMALAARDQRGEAFDLRQFVDEDRAIITQKPIAGQTATVLERPGLWNGSMANWNSVFVEVPKEVFSPVKTVFDLLRDEHQPHGRSEQRLMVQNGLANRETSVRPLIVGEVLFDHFPDGKRVLGGAPFNVAWNLQGLGLAPTFISAIGDDEEGRVVRERMESWRLDTAGLQVSEKWPTGKVRVELNEGQPTFDILNQQAYDDIRFPAFPVTPDEYSMLYVGSLAYRNETSRSTISRLMRDSELPRFVDINIRQPWFDRSWIADLLGGARWIKLNDQELAWLAESECRTPNQIRLAALKLKQLYGGQQYFITCGSAGAYAMDASDDLLFTEAPKPNPMVDSVGAGDAFASAIIAGLSHDHRPLDEIFNSAVRFASRTCTIQGATTSEHSHYVPFQLQTSKSESTR